MSFSDRPGIPLRTKIGCLFAALVGALVCAFLLAGAALGDCAPNPDGSGCENDGFIRFAMFPGSLIVLIIVGIIMAFRVTKDKD